MSAPETNLDPEDSVKPVLLRQRCRIVVKSCWSHRIGIVSEYIRVGWLVLCAEFAWAISCRKAICEEMHPETAYEARPGRAGKCRHDGDISDPALRFTAATAGISGVGNGPSSEPRRL